MVSVLLTLNLVLPTVLEVSWSGTWTEQALFLMIYATAFIVVSFLFIALAGYLAVLVLVAKNLGKLSLPDVSNEEVARALAVRLLTSNQPRWLISLTPCVVPALSFAIAAQFYKDKLYFDEPVLLFEACLLLGLISFTLCVPFILRTQRAFIAEVINNDIGPGSNGS